MSYAVRWKLTITDGQMPTRLNHLVLLEEGVGRPSE